MSWTLFRATVHQRRTSIFWYGLSLVLYAWMTLWFWGEMGPALSEMMESYPTEILAFFGGNEVSFASVGGFLQIEFLGLMWIIIIGSAVVLFAGRAFAGEIGSGTMELVLAQPVSRLKVAITRVVAFIGFVIVLNGCTFVPVHVFGSAYDVAIGARAFWTLLALGTLFTLAVGGIAMLLSSMFRESGRAAAITSGVLLFFWIADMVSNVSEAAEFFEPINLVSYWQPGKIINAGVGTLPWSDALSPESWWAYAGVALVTLVGSVVVFSRRDVA